MTFDILFTLGEKRLLRAHLGINTKEPNDYLALVAIDLHRMISGSNKT